MKFMSNIDKPIEIMVTLSSQIKNFIIFPLSYSLIYIYIYIKHKDGNKINRFSIFNVHKIKSAHHKMIDIIIDTQLKDFVTQTLYSC